MHLFHFASPSIHGEITQYWNWLAVKKQKISIQIRTKESYDETKKVFVKY